MDGFLAALAISFGVIFVAELGDKSQLMAMTFATRFRAGPVLLGISIATAVVHAVSVGIGYGLGVTLPTGWIALAAGLAFLAFGAWTLRGDTLTDAERSKAERTPRSALVGKRLPDRAIRYGAAALFALFGMWLIVESVGHLTGA
jgi:putative Ca2+/H+ antiporter (TMEM165/GDT1 family)